MRLRDCSRSQLRVPYWAAAQLLGVATHWFWVWVVGEGQAVQVLLVVVQVPNEPITGASHASGHDQVANRVCAMVP